MAKQTTVSLKKYSHCPRAYYLAYERNVTPSYIKLQEFLDNNLKESVADVLSRIMHGMVRHEETYLRQWKQRLAQVPTNIFCGDKSPGPAIDEATGQAMNFYKMAYNTIKPNWEMRAINTDFEESFGNVILKHNIDAIGTAGQGNDVFIIDLHKSPPSDFYKRSSIWEWLQVYGYRKLFNAPEQNVFMISVKLGDIIPLPRPTNADFVKMNNEINAIITHLIADEKDGKWMPNYGWHCEKLCGFELICSGMGRE